MRIDIYHKILCFIKKNDIGDTDENRTEYK